jgi:hypothetical protein
MEMDPRQSLDQRRMRFLKHADLHRHPTERQMVAVEIPRQSVPHQIPQHHRTADLCPEWLATAIQFRPNGETMNIGAYRPAHRIREGWHVLQDDGWLEVTEIVRIYAPLNIVWMKFHNEDSIGVAYDEEIPTRTLVEIREVEKRS